MVGLAVSILFAGAVLMLGAAVFGIGTMVKKNIEWAERLSK